MLLDYRRLRTSGWDAHLHGAADVRSDGAGAGRQRRFRFNVLTDALTVGVHCRAAPPTKAVTMEDGKQQKQCKARANNGDEAGRASRQDAPPAVRALVPS